MKPKRTIPFLAQVLSLERKCFVKRKSVFMLMRSAGKGTMPGISRGYVKAIIDFALEREDLKDEIGKYLREIVAILPQSFKEK